MATENIALITLFGAAGDLAHRKLYPSLFKLYQKGYLADHFALLGTSRREKSDEEFQALVADSIKDIKETKAGEAAAFAKHFFYLAFSNMRESSKSVRYCLDQAVVHVANRHTIFGGQMQASLYDLLKRIEKMSEDLRNIANDPSALNVENIIKHGKKLNRDVDKCQIDLLSIIGRQHVSMHASEMYLTFLQAMRDIANRYVAVAMQNRALSQIVVGIPVDTQVQSAQMQDTVASAAIATGNEESLQQVESVEPTASSVQDNAVAQEVSTQVKPQSTSTIENSEVSPQESQDTLGEPTSKS